MKKKKKKLYPTKLRVVIFKAKHFEYRLIKALAKKETKGNVSLLIRKKVLGSLSPKQKVLWAKRIIKLARRSA